MRTIGFINDRIRSRASSSDAIVIMHRSRNSVSLQRFKSDS